MRAFINIAVTVVPFVLIGIGIRFLMRRRGVELTDVQRQAGANRKPRKVFLLGFWRTEE